MLVARILDASVDETWVRGELAALRDRFISRFAQLIDAAALVEFMRGEGFAAADSPQIVEASRIDRVLRSHRGIPISLSIPYLMVGRALGMRTYGINFPGHFLVNANDVVIDPLNATILRPDDVARRLAEANLSHLGDAALARASPDDIAVRMLNNVKATYAAGGDYVAALALIDCQLLLAADHGPLHLERAELWFRLGDAGAAASVLEDAKRQLAGTRWEAEIDRRLQRLARRPQSTIH